MIRFPRAVRLDTSDLRVYEHAASPGELAVPGTFVFADSEPADLTGKALQAFSRGWLGLPSLGYTTLVEVAEIDEDAFEAAVRDLTTLILDRYGAPDVLAAAAAAREEARYAAGLCEHEVHTLLAIERSLDEEGITEGFRVITPSRVADHAKIWSIEPD